MLFKQKKEPLLKCMLQGEDNSLIGSGIIARRADDFMEITNERGLSLLAKGTLVKVVVYEESGSNTIWSGTVYYSAVDRLRLENIVLYADTEKRSLYRVNINSEATLLVYERLRPDPQAPEHSLLYGPKLFEESVLVRNISVGGCMLEVSRRVNIAGKALKLRLEMYGTTEELPVEIRNTREKSPREMLYGMRFNLDNQRIEKAVDAYIFRVQQDQIRRSRR